MKRNIIIQLILTLMCCLNVNAENIKGVVVGVSDGDGFTLLTNDNQTIIVRLLGVDAPEIEGGQPYSQESKEKLSSLINGKAVQVKVHEYDKYGRALGIVSTKSHKDVNLEMIESGMAWHYAYYDNTPRYIKAQKNAKINKIGLWKDEKPINPYNWRTKKNKSSNNWTILIILLISLPVGIYLIISYYAQRLTIILKQKAYQYVLHFIFKANSLSYYRDKQQWISTQFKHVYDELYSKKNQWYVRLCKETKIIELINFYEIAVDFTQKYGNYFNLSHYFAYSEYQELLPLQTKLKKLSQQVIDNDLSKYANRLGLSNEYAKAVKSLEMSFSLGNKRAEHNKEFVEKELIDNKDYFDNVLKYPLDQQQRESIVKLEDNCLVISSAGSGKTSTSIAKVKYLLEKRDIPKEEILVLSYNKKTADEFQERLGVPGLTCKTFHALALSIIAQTEDKRPDVCESTFLLQCYYNLVKKSAKYKDAITKYIGEVASVTKVEHEYHKAEDYYKDRETYGTLAPYGDMNCSPIYTRSEEEKKICTWLTTHGIDFLYEKPYPIETANKDYRQYKPDFTIHYTLEGKKHVLFLEHFGVDKDGNVPSWFGEGVIGGFEVANNKYNEGIKWKRRIHDENNTKLIETTSAMFHNGTIYQKLEKQLRDAGVIIRELSTEEKYALLFERNKAMEENIMSLFTSFISLMKSNDKTFESIIESIEDSGQEEVFINRCKFLIYKVIKPLYDEYEVALKENGQMDFTDLILHAAELCEQKEYTPPYSYILVDEFQDISIDRYKFLVSLRNESPLTKMYCVGDDWQSIYRFSGSDLNLFNNYEEYFGYTEKCKIETTYRFGNPLIDASSTFILCNPIQVRKEVKPFKLKCNIINGTNQISRYKENKTELSFVPFVRGQQNSDYLNTIKAIIDSIPESESIMLLGRYNHEVNIFPQKNINHDNNGKRATVTYAGRVMQFLSVHASKGLEADHVILLNCSQDKAGFPSRISDDPILGYVLSKIDSFEYSEERRLFYVAITRAKKHTHVMYNVEMPSVFVTEVMNQDNSNEMLCPMCKKGRLKVIKESVASNGKPYRNYVCSNSVAGCRFFWRVFYNEAEEITDIYHQQMAVLSQNNINRSNFEEIEW